MKSVVGFTILSIALAVPFVSRKNDFKPKEEGEISPRIINGWEVEPHSRPFQVWLNVVGGVDGPWLCGGTLITPNYVLTAAHCAVGAKYAKVLLGAHNILLHENNTVFITSTEITIHEEFNNEIFANDIAVMKLETPAPINDVIQTISLPNRADLDNIYTGQVAILSGWGVIDRYATELSPVLRAITSPVIDNFECKNTFNNVIDTQGCISGAGGVSSCLGDYGDPLTIDGIQIGILSYQNDLCQQGLPSVFTRINNYADWIQTHTDYVFQ